MAVLILAHPAYLTEASIPSNGPCMKTSQTSMSACWRTIVLQFRLFKKGNVSVLDQRESAGSPLLRLCKELLSDIYSIHTLHVSPSDVGFTMIARPRLYILLLRKGHVHLAVDLPETYDHVKADFKARVGRPNAAAAFMASAEECLAAENDLRRRRGLEPAAMSASDWTYLFLTLAGASLPFQFLVASCNYSYY